MEIKTEPMKPIVENDAYDLLNRLAALIPDMTKEDSRALSMDLMRMQRITRMSERIARDKEQGKPEGIPGRDKMLERMMEFHPISRSKKLIDIIEPIKETK